MKKFFFLLITVLSCAATQAQDASKDKLLSTVERELNREVTEFTKVALPPYFIDYRISDEEGAYVTSSFGSLIRSETARDRTFKVQVRVGDYLVDHTHPKEGRDNDSYNPYVSSSSLPLDDNEDAVTLGLWRATQSEYRWALERYNAVRNQLAAKKNEKLPPDFSKEAAEKYYEAPGAPFSELFRKEQWEEKTKQYSKLFLGDASIINADASFSAGIERRYYVSSEGASVVQNFTSAYINIEASVRATDGEIVPLHQSYYAPTAAELPGDQTIENDIRTMIATLQKLKTAPLADPYTGPALLDGPVSGVFFHEIFGHRVEGHRLKSEADGQTFKSKVNQKILPESISVYCDPTIGQFAGTYLNGIYQYDDEGVKSKRVSVVEKGTLKNFLMSRSPLENFSHSNGHARATAGLSPVSRQSNLFVDAAKTKSNTELRQMLIKECQRQKKEYGYYFKSVVGGFTFTDRYTPNAFNIFPTEVYRVYVNGKPDELVRGVDLIGTPLAMFAEIAAVGDTHGVFTGFCGAESGYVPVSAISPSLFVRRIETQKKPKTKVEETVLPAPVSSAVPGKLPVVQQAMQDELERNMKDLKSESFERPFFINYAIIDETVTQITATLGAIENSTESSARNAGSTRLLVGDYEFNDESLDNNLFSPAQANEISLPIGDDYMGIRRSLWISTDNVYRNASMQFAKNKEMLKEQNKPLSELSHRSFSKVTTSKIDISAAEVRFDKAATENYVRKLSAAFVDNKNIENSGVRFYYRRGYRYLVNSEGSINRVPFSNVILSVTAGLRSLEGEFAFDNRTYYYDTPDLPPVETIIADAKKMADQIVGSLTVPKFGDEYIGPVLFEEQSSAEILGSAMLVGGNSLSVNNNIQSLTGLRYEETVRIGKPLYAEGVTVKALPKLKKYGDVTLLGSYEVDSEGVVPADETVLVENGVLKALMNDRTITKQGQTANGLKDGPGVLSVTFKTVVPQAEMKSKLIARAKKEGLDYALIVRSQLNAGRMAESEVYKVYVADGREERVRGSAMKEMSQRDYKRITDASKETLVWNFVGEPGTYSVICPRAVIFEEVEFSPSNFPTMKKDEYVPNPLKK